MKDKYNGKKIGTGAALRKNYHNGLWQQEKTDKNYFTELLRVSKNQIIWGGNYFADMLPTSQGWIVWDKMHVCERTFADCELAYTSFDRATKIFRYMWDGFIQGDMKDKEDRIHPTQKPVALYTWLLNRYAEDGYKILDTHVGSASSLIACHRKGLKYVGFEIDKCYYEKAKARLEEEISQTTIFDVLEGENGRPQGTNQLQLTFDDL